MLLTNIFPALPLNILDIRGHRAKNIGKEPYAKICPISPESAVKKKKELIKSYSDKLESLHILNLSCGDQSRILNDYYKDYYDILIDYLGDGDKISEYENYIKLKLEKIMTTYNHSLIISDESLFTRM